MKSNFVLRAILGGAAALAVGAAVAGPAHAAAGAPGSPEAAALPEVVMRCADG
jgi:hypothetical protein